MMSRVVNFIESSKRIFAVSKKPTKEEWVRKIKITLVAVIFLGILGYLISEAVRFLMSAFAH